MRVAAGDDSQETTAATPAKSVTPNNAVQRGQINGTLSKVLIQPVAQPTIMSRSLAPLDMERMVPRGSVKSSKSDGLVRGAHDALLADLRGGTVTESCTHVGEPKSFHVTSVAYETRRRAVPARFG